MKLLNKTLKPFALYALLVMAMSVPAYFFIINFIWKRELDKHHTVIRNEVEKEMNALQLDDSAMVKFLQVWNKIQPRTKITPATRSVITNDSTYTSIRFDPHEKEIEQFRGSSTTIIINNRPFQLLVETNMEEFYETLVIIVLITAVFFLMLLTGLILMNRRLSLKIWKPFYDTLFKLKAFDLNKPGKLSFQYSDIDEFEALNAELSILTERNRAAFRQQKEFTENASHELQTPLALLKSKVDLLLQDPTLTRDQSGKIAALYLNLNKVSRINKNLLLLAKLENRQFTENELIQVDKVLAEHIETISDHFAAKNISLETSIGDHITINTNLSLFEIMITNLLLNAILHNQVNGKITIHLHPKEFIVSNTGHSPLQSETLFQRFINTSKEVSGSGLGLAIVKEICIIQHWDIFYAFENDLHIFTVRF